MMPATLVCCDERVVAGEARLEVGERGVGLGGLGLAEPEASGGAGALPLLLHQPLEFSPVDSDAPFRERSPRVNSAGKP